jgi:hypothetical protein
LVVLKGNPTHVNVASEAQEVVAEAVKAVAARSKALAPNAVKVESAADTFATCLMRQAGCGSVGARSE